MSESLQPKGDLRLFGHNTGALQTMRQIFGYARVMWRKLVDLLKDLSSQKKQKKSRKAPEAIFRTHLSFWGPVFGKSALLNAAWDRF